MTTAAIQDRVDELFADARNVHAQAIERLQNGDTRDAAEKAWCATKNATSTLILAWMGEDPSTNAANNNLGSLHGVYSQTESAQNPTQAECLLLLPVPSSRYLQRQLDTQLHQESLTNSVTPPTVPHMKVHHGFSGQLRNPNPWPTLPWNGDVLQKPLAVDLHQVIAP